MQIAKKQLDMYTHVIKQRGKLLGIPQSIVKSTVADFRNLIQNNGLAYTVERFKTIKQCIIKYRAEECRLPDDFYIKRRSGSHTHMYGHYGKLQDLAMKDKKNFRKVLLFLNLYTVISTQDGLTTHLAYQHKLMIEEPQSEDQSNYCKEFAAKIDSKLMSEIKQIALAHIPSNWEQSKCEAFRRNIKMFFHKPEDYVFSSMQKEHQENSFSYDWYTFVHSKTFARLYDTNAYKPIMQSLVNFFPQKFIASDSNSMETEYNMANINLLEQPGMKYRYVAAFKKPLEHLVKPVGDMLYNMVACLPWDITFQEEKCFTSIQERLRSGQLAHSVDMKNATDRFPWVYQHKVIKELYPNNRRWQSYVSLYDELIHLPAAYSGESGLTARWEVGQPLGSYPSFAIFTMTHGIILYILNECQWDEKFWIHGDDIVILDDALASKYKEFLANSGVATSAFKTITSNRLAEINSKVITAGDVIVIPKWKFFDGKNVIEMVRHWGPKAIDIAFPGASTDELKTMKRIASLPIVGAESNPEGLSLEERINGIEEILLSTAERALAYEGSCIEPLARRYSIVVPTYAIYGKGKYKYTCYQRCVEKDELIAIRDLFGTDFPRLFRVEETAPKYKTDIDHFRSMLVAKEHGVLLDRAHLGDIYEAHPDLPVIIPDGECWTASTILELIKYNLYSVDPSVTVNGRRRRIGTKLSWQEKNKGFLPRLKVLLSAVQVLQSNNEAYQMITSWSKVDKMESSPVLAKSTG